jgi:hypothetical protein
MGNESSFAAAIESSARLPLVTTGRMPPTDGAVLFILCAYPREELARRAGLLTRMTLWGLDAVTIGRLRAHRVLYRDHYANPRPLAYLVGLVERFRRQADLRRAPDLIIDRSFGDEAQSCARDFAQVEIADLHDPMQSALARNATDGRYAAVILVWPDALGLGWEPLQRWATRLPLVIAMNGRRRAFSLDRSTRRALATRRFFAHTRLAEAIFALCAYPVAGFCALVDAVRRP